MVLPYGKNIRYRPAPKRTKKAVQQINSIQYINKAGKPDLVPVTVATSFNPISLIKQGTAVDQCTGTSVYAKSLYFQAEVSLGPYPAVDDQWSSFNLAAGPAVDLNKPNAVTQVDTRTAKSKNVRVVVLLDRAPNGTTPNIGNVYKTDIATPLISNYSATAGGVGDASAILALDPDKTRRFKILLNEVVNVTENAPIAHVEKYIPLNFYMTFSGNTGDPAPAWQITNGIYCIAFTSVTGGITVPGICQPLWAFTSKLRFEP